MKTAWTLAIGLALACIPSPKTSAQTSAQLGLQAYPGLTITGTVGTVYSVNYTTNLTEAGNPDAWRCLEFLQLPASPYLWIDKSAPATGQRFYRAVAYAAPPNMAFLPPGTFWTSTPMDAPDREAWEPEPTAVTLSRGFWMGRYEVTQGEFGTVMGYNPSWFQGDRTSVGGRDYGSDQGRPVETVTWHEAMSFCEKLTQRERSAGRLPAGCGYRLPTEAEWEYACRAWTSTRYGYGDDPGYAKLANYAWYAGNSGDMTHPVGQKLPNRWGLHDMHGNVQEWCLDWWWAGAPEKLALDPQGPASGSRRVVRGGFWYLDADHCRSMDRFSELPTSSFASCGFRVVLAPARP